MSERQPGGPVEILLVEDNPADVRLTQEALKEGKVFNNLHWAKDGVEALEFLRREGRHAGAPRPASTSPRATRAMKSRSP